MKPQAVIPSLGLFAQAILSFPLCAGRPHAHGHSHDGRTRHTIGNYTASSGSSLIFHSAAATWGPLNDSPRRHAAPGAFKGVSDLSINPTIHISFSDVKPSHKPNQASLHTLASLVGTGSHAPTNSCTSHQEDLTVTFIPSPSSPVTIMTSAKVLATAVTVVYSSSSDTPLRDHVGLLTQPSSTTHSYSTPEAFISRPTAPRFKVRRAHAELHRTRSDRASQTSGPVSARLALRLTLRADDNEICPTQDKTTFASQGSKTYQIACDVDFPDNHYPFLLVQSFEECVDACDALNTRENADKCVAALFVPSRLNGVDDCYLKSSVDHPAPANVHIEGAVLVKADQSPQLAATYRTSSMQGGPTPASDRSKYPNTADSTKTYSSKSASWGPNIKYASAESVVTPALVGTKLHGPSQNVPTKQYLEVKPPKLVTLDADILVVGVNDDISTHYGMSLDTGVLDVNASSQALLAPLKNTPHLSRDGGQGGYLNGQHLFIFSDTGSYSTTTSTANGDFLGFVSSSVSIDVGMNGLENKALNLKDGMGQWSDDVGRMRGFAPLTQGEQSYNQAMQGKGQRYAIWPESSLIPLANETALLYAPIVYTNVNHDTKKAVFIYTGSTLLSVTAGGMGGPMAQRTVDRIFEQDEIEWGCAGGIRSWGPSGIGGSDGKVYVFGNTQGGMLLSRTSADAVADRDSYEYWDGNSWSSEMLDRSSKAFFISGSPFMDVDIFYSPRHLTFIAVYLTAYADSTFYYRYLKADSAVIPSYAPGGDESADAVEKMVQHEWSDEQLLYQAPEGLEGHYIYAGGVHQGYYGADDITNGGSRMLLSWTSPTGLDPSTLKSEYEIVTAEVHWE